MKYLRDSFKFYEGDVKFKTFIKINKLFFKFIINKVFEGKTVYIPKNLGFFEIRAIKKRPKINKKTGEIENMAISWGKTFKLWNSNPEAKRQRKVVKVDNLHSEGHMGKFVWSKYGVLLLNKTLYELRLSRGNKRRIYREFINGNYKKFKIIDYGT